MMMNVSDHPRIIFLGQKKFGEAAWEYLRSRTGPDFEVVAVVTNFDSASVWWNSNEVYRLSDNRPAVDSSRRNNDKILEAIEQYRANWLISVQHPWIISAEILAAVGGRAVNFHNAKLPEYQGYNSVNHAILNRERTFVVTAHWMAPEVDEGDIIYEASFPIEPNDTAVSLHAKSHYAGMALFRKIVGCLADREELPRRKIHGESRFYSRDSINSLREISSLSDSREVSLKSRAFFFPPFEPAYVILNGGKYHILPPGAYREAEPQVWDKFYASRLVDELPPLEIIIT